LNLRSWLQLFRAQTAPASVLLVLIPYLVDNPLFLWKVLVLAIFILLVHWFSFGENSLMDTVMGYDREDPGKSHHPLISGAISLPLAHNVIHWGLIALTTAAVLLTYWISPNPLPAMAALAMWVALGHGYNEGLSKESLFGFISISLCFTSMAAWAWFLSHGELTPIAQLYLVYVFTVILFQISWSGHLKEMGQSERSNILIKMGARVITEVRDCETVTVFEPGPSAWYGAAIKIAGVMILVTMTPPVSSIYILDKLAWVIMITILTACFMTALIIRRPYNRSSDLVKMSAMEIVSIYAPIPLMLPWSYSIVLMIAGVVYFVGINRWLWGVSYPRV